LSVEKKQCLKIWLYPRITFLLVVFEKFLVMRDGLGGDEVVLYLFIFVMIFIFGIGGIAYFAKGIHHYFSAQDRTIGKYLAVGLLLNLLTISIPSWAYIENYMRDQKRERYNAAVDQIHEIHYSILDLLADPDFAYPSEFQDLEWLRPHIHRPFENQRPLVDPWGRPHGFRLENDMLYVWSYGPDGLSGTDDDIDHKSRWRTGSYRHWPAP